MNIISINNSNNNNSNDDDDDNNNNSGSNNNVKKADKDGNVAAIFWFICVWPVHNKVISSFQNLRQASWRGSNGSPQIPGRVDYSLSHQCPP
ncbi:hypothetical protein PoB_004456200 [Plakobranchus ocellatus]|uniref:Uncharacterized protein n=1 Tax=Plakobranchus ocellatus TaxID=259542 RepID=A0AAV4BFM0_9GAST|nr:hypothetical protein PoB_004456200 [Plakobranchus ocellatus]